MALAWRSGIEHTFKGLRLDALPVSEPGPRDVLLRIRAVALNHRDLLIATGRYHRRGPVGSILCSDAAGEVVACGPEVSAFSPGDRVTTCFIPGWNTGALSRTVLESTLGSGHTPGVLAETVVLPQDALLAKPESLSFEEAATLPCAGLTAWHALFEANSTANDTCLLTLGTGGVAVFAAQFALAVGARVIATSHTSEKRARLLALGVAETIDYRDVPLWGERARVLSGGDGVDNVIEVGGQGTLEQSLRAVRPGGTVSLIGTLAPPTPVSLLPVLLRNIRLQGIVAGSKAMFARMNTAVERWKVQPVVDRVFNFTDAPAAFEYFASGRHFGKVVIRVGEAD